MTVDDSGMNFFCFINPTIINPPAMGTKRPDSIARDVVRFQNMVLFPSPPKLDPLPAVDETYSYSIVVKPWGPLLLNQPRASPPPLLFT